LQHWGGKIAQIGPATIRRAENSQNETSMNVPNDLAVRRALEAAGVEFIDGDGGSPGSAPAKVSTEKVLMGGPLLSLWTKTGV